MLKRKSNAFREMDYATLLHAYEAENHYLDEAENQPLTLAIIKEVAVAEEVIDRLEKEIQRRDAAMARRETVRKIRTRITRALPKLPTITVSF